MLINAISLQERVRQLVKKHGGLRKAARAVQIEPGYLSRLESGERVAPGKLVLQRLGLRRVVAYEATPEATGALTTCDMDEDESI